MNSFKYIWILFMFGLSVSLSAQLNTLSTQYMFNKMSINPAYAGVRRGMELTVLHRTQWQGINGAPTHQLLSVNLPLWGDNFGAGLNVVNLSYGITKYLELSLPYSYAVKAGSYTIKMGSSIQFKSYTEQFANGTVSIDNKGTDNAIPSSDINGQFLNFGLGTYIYGQNSYFGLSTQSLIKDLDLAGNGVALQDIRNVDLMAGYDFKYNDYLSILTQTMVRWNNRNQTILDVNAMVRLDNGFSAGTGIRLGRPVLNSLLFNFGFNIKQGYFGLAYDYPLSGLRGAQLGSYELVGYYKFNIKKSVYEGFNPRFF